MSEVWGEQEGREEVANPIQSTPPAQSTPRAGARRRCCPFGDPSAFANLHTEPTLHSSIAQWFRCNGLRVPTALERDKTTEMSGVEREEDKDAKCRARCELYERQERELLRAIGMGSSADIQRHSRARVLALQGIPFYLCLIHPSTPFLAPSTLHPAPCRLLPAPCPYILCLAPYTLNPVSCTFDFTP